jgi:hypothetical protein
MTDKEKQLLLKDLSARFPYGVKCKVKYIINNETTYGRDVESECIDAIKKISFDACSVYTEWLGYETDIEDIKPYLRPMSSMTEEEKKELLRFGTVSLDKDSNAIDVCCVGFWNHAKVQDYLNSIHIDYRGLIEKGLAIAVTEENNPYKT